MCKLQNRRVNHLEVNKTTDSLPGLDEKEASTPHPAELDQKLGVQLGVEADVSSDFKSSPDAPSTHATDEDRLSKRANNRPDDGSGRELSGDDGRGKGKRATRLERATFSLEGWTHRILTSWTRKHLRTMPRTFPLPFPPTNRIRRILATNRTATRPPPTARRRRTRTRAHRRTAIRSKHLPTPCGG